MTQDFMQWIISTLTGPQSLVGLLVMIGVAGYREVWVWGKHYRKLEKEKDRWQSLALSTTSLAREALSVSQRQES